MPNVRILPPEVISRIAAGEVIERPASVVKELLENSLDAGATAIEIHLEKAGRTSIVIKDNGSGINSGDLTNLFSRHATSKISQLDDVFNIASLGFRGEALYSISAISEVTLKSKTSDSDNGWQIEVQAEKKQSPSPCSMNTGTELTVRELFFNTPARRKFLKSDTTELNQILSIVIPYTILYPQVRFLLTHNKRIRFDLAPQDTISRTASVLNLNPQHLIETERNLPDEQTSVRLLLSDSNIQRPKRNLQYIFINQRPVHHQTLSYHLNQVYRMLLPQGSYPFFSVLVTVPPDTVDVNIHPTKQEVKIRNDYSLVSFTKAIAEQALTRQSKPKKITLSSEPLQYTKPELAVETSSLPIEVSSPKPKISEDIKTRLIHTLQKQKQAQPKQYVLKTPSGVKPPPEPESSFSVHSLSLKAKLDTAEFIGSFINKYLIFQTRDTLLFIDQHAAHERITFEKLKKQLDSHTVEVQRLLVPLTLGLSPQEMTIWEESKQTLHDIGFETTLFDKRTIAVHTYPLLLSNHQQSLRNLLAGGNIVLYDTESLAKRACRQSFMTRDTINRQEAENLRRQLLRCRIPFTCPHGRPTVIEMTEKILRKQFLR